MPVITAPLHDIYLKYLLKFNPPALFEKLYRLKWYSDLHEGWINGLNCAPNQHLLEVGCGPGLLALATAKQNINISAIDHSADMVKVAKRNTAVLDNVTVHQGDVKALAFDNDQFDVVIAASLLNVIKAPDKAMMEMKRTLKPGGKLSFLVPNKSMGGEKLAHYISSMKLRGFSAKALQTWASKPPKFTRERAMALAEQSQLRNITIDEHLDGMVYTVTGSK